MDSEKYENKLKRAQRIVKPRLGRNPNAEQARVYANELEQYEINLLVYREQVAIYRAENKRLYDQFKLDLFEDAGLADHPKRETAFNLAKEYGGSGYSEIWITLQELAELMVD